MTINILFLIQDESMPSSRVRVCNLLNNLKNHQIESEVIKYPSGILNKIRLFKRCKKFDAVYLQKRLLTPIDVFILKRSALFLVFDFDDAIYCKHESTKIDERTNRYHKFKSVVSSADLVIAGNKVLQDVANKLNNNIEIIPSAVFVKNVPQKNYTVKNEKIVIGWVGGSINLPYLNLLSPVLKKLSEKHSIQLRIICDKGLEIEGVDVNFVPWRIETQDAEIAAFDIGIMPLADSLHASGKCGYKALQYMAAAVPAVVSDVGINGDIVKHGELGFVAKEISDFHGALERLIMSPSKRETMGIASRREIEDVYSVEAVGKLLANVLKKNICKN